MPCQENQDPRSRQIVVAQKKNLLFYGGMSNPIVLVTTRWWLSLVILTCSACLPQVLQAQDQAQVPFPPAEEMHKQITELGDTGNAKLEKKDLPGAEADFRKGFLYSQEMSRLYEKDAQFGPIYSEQCYYFLERLGVVYSDMGKLPHALQVTEQAAQGYVEMAEAKKTIESSQPAADLMGRLAWLQLQLNKPVDAITSSRKALSLDSTQPWMKTNLAHGLLLTGKKEEALSIYRIEQATELGDGRTFAQAALKDLDDLEKVGVTNPSFNDVRKLYGAAAANPPPTVKDARKRGRNISFLVIGGIILAIGGIFGGLTYLEKKRTQKVQALVTSWGWTFRAAPTSQDQVLITGTHLPTLGHHWHLKNFIELPQGAEQVRLFDFNYTRGHGKSKQTYDQSVFQIISPLVAELPALMMKPEGLFDKLASAFGSKDIDFPEHPTFSKKYLLKGDNEEAIRKLFTSDIITFFEKEKGWAMEVSNGRLLLYKGNFRPKPDDIQQHVNKCQEIVNIVTGGVV